MNAEGLLDRVQFLVDAKGKQSAVLVKMEDWEELLIILEDLEDAEEIRLCRKIK